MLAFFVVVFPEMHGFDGETKTTLLLSYTIYFNRKVGRVYAYLK